MPKDYLHDQNFDLLIKTGDFIVGESTAQHQRLLLLAEKGEWRQYPKTGVGIGSFLDDDEPGDLFSEIRKQFDADGMTVNSVRIFEDGKMNIDAKYRE